MHREQVTSSFIKGIGYQRGVLEVEFTTGAKIQYDDVTSQEHQDFMRASSKGSYFHQNIRPRGGRKIDN
ncbi:KTSC domain-containing protein [Candidatus Pacearchaeota archaeon]|nr:KTSC domain-containing protein [Candidatus Pacearchaeota archaeon]